MRRWSLLRRPGRSCRGPLSPHVLIQFVARPSTDLAEHASQRKRYDAAIDAILKRFTLDLVIPLKQARSQATSSSGTRKSDAQPDTRPPAQLETVFDGNAFVGHSFLPSDKRVADCVIQSLTAIGVAVVDRAFNEVDLRRMLEHAGGWVTLRHAQGLPSSRKGLANLGLLPTALLIACAAAQSRALDRSTTVR